MKEEIDPQAFINPNLLNPGLPYQDKEDHRTKSKTFFSSHLIPYFLFFFSLNRENPTL